MRVRRASGLMADARQHPARSRTTSRWPGSSSAHLRARGYDVTVAPTAEAAGRARSGQRPDLVLLDINLPGETGWSVLRSDAYGRRRPPVVVASAMAVSPPACANSASPGYLPKPFALDTLRSTLDRVLGTETETNA